MYGLTASAAPVKASFPFATSPRPFRRRCPNVLPRRALAPAACALAAFLVAGCGASSGKVSAGQTVLGAGFQFQAPSGWIITRTASSAAAHDGPVDRIEVVRFALVRAYRPALAAGVSRELDAVAAHLAEQLAGRVVRRSRVELAHASAWSYRIDYGTAKTQEIAFVLEGGTEYELLCRRRVSELATPCGDLFSSFALASG
jgi:hypothetical protein